jgi:hypothetical protein
MTPFNDQHFTLIIYKDELRLFYFIFNPKVEMGPFKHEVDDGLDLRKAAFECMYTLLDTCVDRLDIFEFLTHVQDGLKDHYDIKV